MSLLRGAVVALAFLLASAEGATAKLPGTVHCFNDICHRVRTVAETEARRGIIEPVVASFYDSPENDRFNPRLETSSGSQFDPDAPDNAASPIHPDGTILLIWSPATRGAAIVRVNNAGPYYPGRTLDVSRGTAQRLGFSRGGVMELLTVVIAAPSEPDTHYQRGRVYPKVRGYLGTFDNLVLASLAEPAARDALLPVATGQSELTLTPTQQLILAATEDHIRRTALTHALLETPPDLLPPPEGDFVASAPIGTWGGARVASADAGSSVMSMIATSALADVSSPAAEVQTLILPVALAAPKRAPDVARPAHTVVERAAPAYRHQRNPATTSSDEVALTFSSHSTRGWFDKDIPVDR